MTTKRDKTTAPATKHVALLQQLANVASGDPQEIKVVYQVVPSDPKIAVLVDELREGDWVYLVARVSELKRTGGYTRNATPPRCAEPVVGVRPEDTQPFVVAFTFDPSEIFLLR